MLAVGVRGVMLYDKAMVGKLQAGEEAAGDGEVIFDGAGNAVLFDLEAANYNYFEGITVRNTEVGFLLGRKHIAGSSGFTPTRRALAGSTSAARPESARPT